MTKEITPELVRLLQNFPPQWVMAIVVAMILSYRLPEIIREVFAGIRGIITANSAARKFGRRSHNGSAVQRSKRGSGSKSVRLNVRQT
jgi:hypothetical protein